MAGLQCILKTRSDRRAVALLEYRGKRHVNIIDNFIALADVDRNRFERRFQRWVNGAINDRHFHGFPGANKRCFVFKSDNHRIYGFVYHPETNDPRFRFCCLTTYATKNQRRTDPAILDRVLGFANDPIVLFAIERFCRG